jgi:hydrogenase nickel incorporation protein HypA/HybF
MHELSVCQSLLEQVTALAQTHYATEVTAIKLRLGPLGGIEADLLAHAFTIARAGTVAAQAQLHIDILPVRIRCPACAQEAEVSPNQLLCPHCGAWQTQIISGDELLLVGVEMLTAENA